MRPNIDIPHQLHGAVKDWSETEGVSVNQAYRQLLRRGLEEQQAPAGMD